MQFFDEVKISIQSGKGGNGVACGRRESAVPHGGPAGGDGGRGGSIIFQASKDENTLLPYRYKKIFKAKHGENGQSKDKYGSDGEDLMLKVPIGTIIKDEQSSQILFSFDEDGQTWTALKGGVGGRGNIHFKDSVNQYPDFAMLGEPGNHKDVVLELQLLGDVALIGTPSVGKSTIINSISNTKAKTAEYHFTTLIPNLGSVSHKDFNFNVIDIPGLIKGASDGKGLGNTFLRHVLKSRVFCLVSDISRYENGMTEISELLDEIMSYAQEKLVGIDKKPIFEFENKNGMINFKMTYDGDLIFEKIIIFALNKYDLIQDVEILDEYKKTFFNQIQKFLTKKIGNSFDEKLLDHNTIVISGYTRFGLDKLLDKIVMILENCKDISLNDSETKKTPQIKSRKKHQDEDFEPIIDITEKEKDVLIQKGLIDEVSYKFCKVWEIKNSEVCKYVFMLPRGNNEAENWFWKHLHESGYISRFEKNKIQKGDILKIISFYQGLDDKYIVY